MHPFRARALLALVLASAVSSLACSSPLPEKEARCDLRPGKAQCTDIRKFEGPTLVSFQGVCETLKSSTPNATGYQEDATCPTAGMLGGCQTKSADGSLQTNWYYMGTEYPDATAAKAECDSGQTWVNPA
jgi:hypothetical protein